ncbi:MAG TPA: hypothetical protein DCL41_10710 [Bdellovibrionales bacterium]|nr:hypothetical protein [Pseudobdellovibrionaceae bacterium]HAG92337.1 hypothetical protein [Bdellovibrionales bacterium]|tara:strand:+ start:25604 stop:26719 length:1116 start_codon:yes stop_codon:yes gene_type:complete
MLAIRLITFFITISAPIHFVWASKEIVELTVGKGLTYPVYADSIEISQETKQVSAFILAKDTSVELARGNKFDFYKGDKLALHPNGFVASSVINHPLGKTNTWKLPSGQEVILNCGKIPPSSFNPVGAVRVVRFYESGEYERGCDLQTTTTLPLPMGEVTLSYASKLELFESGSLKYGSYVRKGSLTLFDSKFELQPRSEIYFFSDTQISFCTPKSGEHFKAWTTQFGTLEFVQPEKTVSISLFENGEIKRAIVKNALEMGGLEIPPFSQIVLSRIEDKEGKEPTEGPTYLAGAVLSEPRIFSSMDGYKIETLVPGFNRAEQVIGVVANKAFTFTNPDSNEEFVVKKEARVHFQNGLIVGIENPTKNPNSP